MGEILQKKSVRCHKFQNMYFLLQVLLLMLQIILNQKHYTFGMTLGPLKINFSSIRRETVT